MQRTRVVCVRPPGAACARGNAIVAIKALQAKLETLVRPCRTFIVSSVRRRAGLARVNAPRRVRAEGALLTRSATRKGKRAGRAHRTRTQASVADLSGCARRTAICR